MTAVKAVAHTPGPWHVCVGIDERDFIVAEPTGNTVCEPNVASYMDPSEFDPAVHCITFAESQANACLIAAAPDHALFGRAITAGLIRWEPFAGNTRVGEICCNGLRYSTTLDEFGVPHLPDVLRAVLAKVEAGQGDAA